MVECTLDSMFRLLCSGDLACDKFSGAVLFAVACGLISDNDSAFLRRASYAVDFGVCDSLGGLLWNM